MNGLTRLTLLWALSLMIMGLAQKDTDPGWITLRAEIWADNWFALYLGDQLIGEDPVPITTERSFNATTFTFRARYPLQLGLIARDYMANDTGLEYIGTSRQQMGDGGIIAQFTDVSTGKVIAVTDQKARVLVTHRAPLDRGCATETQPVAGQGKCTFISLPKPDHWNSPDFDDSRWSPATVYTESQVQPKEGYQQIRWSPVARLIWSSDLLADNTVLMRLSVPAPPANTDHAPKLQYIQSRPTAQALETICQDRVARFVAAGTLARASCQGDYLLVESNGLAREPMMVGITAWQQQVPLPQPYTGSNAYRIPLYPLRSPTPTPTSGVGAVGIAVNGVPIFNPSKPSQGGNQEVYDPRNDPRLIGELDRCGGHSGRGDDYHYHAGPVCLLDTLGSRTGGVVGYALDGYPILEFHDAGEVLPTNLDNCNGHEHDNLGYHYHLTEKAPYVVGCFRGSVANAFQPQTMHVRPAGGPIKATITALTTSADGWTTLSFVYNNTQQWLLYRPEGDCYRFRYPQPAPPTSPGQGEMLHCERRR